LSSELDEIWALYADDGGQALDLAEETLLELMNTPGDAGHIAALFRAIHTFKGNARVLGLANIERCAHSAEDLIGIVRDENVPLTTELHGLLLEAVDYLREMLNVSIARRSDPDLDGAGKLIARIDATIETCRAAMSGEQGAEAEPEALVFEPQTEAGLAQDSGYQEVFAGMAAESLIEAREVLKELRAGELQDGRSLFASVDHLRFAAQQMALANWMELLGEFTSQPEPPAAALEALISGMEALLAAKPAQPQAAETKSGAEVLKACEVEAPAEAISEAQAQANGCGVPEDCGVILLSPPSGKPSNGSTLSADPTYRAIFFDIVHDILREMEAAIGEFGTGGPGAKLALDSHVDRLTHAARQIGMAGWLNLLAGYPSNPSEEEARSFVAKLEAQAELDAAGTDFTAAGRSDSASDPVCKFFESLPPLLANVSSFGSLLSTGNPVDTAAFLAAVEEIGAGARSLELVVCATHTP
jgi:two-component system, chemotaxis family, sensor kinase CheA